MSRPLVCFFLSINLCALFFSHPANATFILAVKPALGAQAITNKDGLSNLGNYTGGYFGIGADIGYRAPETFVDKGFHQPKTFMAVLSIDYVSISNASSQFSTFLYGAGARIRNVIIRGGISQTQLKYPNSANTGNFSANGTGVWGGLGLSADIKKHLSLEIGLRYLTEDYPLSKNSSLSSNGSSASYNLYMSLPLVF